MSVILDIQKKIEDFKHDCQILCESMMISEGGLNPILMMLIEKDGELVAAVAPTIGESYNKDNKSLVRNVIASIIEKMKPIAIGIASESWLIVRPTKEEVDFTIPVSEQEDRKEAVCIQFETYNSSSLVVLDIIRNGDNIELVKDTVLSSDVDKSQTEGTFCNLLNVNYEKFYKELETKIKNSLN